jgi:proteasome lid subunit RPN8/RPN11
VLRLSVSAYAAMVGHCLDELPYEGCGLLAGASDSYGADDAHATRCYPTGNAARSSRVYTVEPRDMLRADRDAEAAGLAIIGVFHSHTHTDAYPSPTDVAQAPIPEWHYVLVSLRDTAPVVRSYRIVDGKIAEETVVLDRY